MTETAWLIIAVIGYSLAGVGLISAAFIYFKLDIPDVIGDLSGKTVARALKQMRDNGLPERNTKHRQVAMAAPSGKGSSPKASNLSADKSSMSYAHESKRLDKSSGATGRTSGATGRTSGATGRTSGATGRTSGATGRMSADQPRKITRGRATENLSTGTEVLEFADTDVLDEYDTAVLSGNETSVLPEAYPEEKPSRVSLPTEKLSSDATARLDAEDGNTVPMTAVLNDEKASGGTQVLSEEQSGGTTVLGTQVLADDAESSKRIVFSVIRNYSVTHTDETIIKA